MDSGAPTEWIEGVLAAQADLNRAIEGLSDQVAGQPSLLPDWTVGHVLTHIARNADSVVWRLEGAATGALRDQYPGGFEQRTGDIEGGSARSADELVADVRQSSTEVERTMAALPADAWDAPSRTARGVVEPSREAIFSRWREVVVHHGDLGLGPVPLPAGIVEVWLPRELPLLDQRADPAELMAWVLGRGPAPTLRGW
jgi:maleylpyruvate isomerase